MNQLDNTPRKTGRIVILVTFVIVLALVAALIFVLAKSNNNSKQSSTTDTNTQAPASDQPTQKTPEEQTPTAPSATGTVITTGSSEFGTMLFNEKKQAIYIWEVEKSEKPECYGDCTEAWPPVLADGTPRATGEVKSELLGTVKRTDGTTQVTYNGHPLYYYAHEAPGEVKCHNISTHGGLWWVIQPNGNRAN